MNIKIYKDTNNNIFYYPIDGSQDNLIEDKVLITQEEANVINEVRFAKIKEEALARLNYAEKRILEYPPMQNFVDAWVKNDQDALEEYRQACLAVKNKYPKT